jgi:hypothetical protein
MPKSPIVDLFDYAHLPNHLRDVSRPFGELAAQLDAVRHEARERYYKLDEAPEGQGAGPGEIERRAISITESQTDRALEALLVAKDAAVRAALSAAKIK